MSDIFGMFVSVNQDGSSTTGKVKKYNSYQEMVDDTSPGQYAILVDTNTVYHRVDGHWVVGFPNVVNDDDYTAFEVFAHDYDIPVGECEELGGYVNTEIPSGMVHEFTIRSKYNREEIDVIVDYGDDNIIHLKEIEPTTDGSTYNYNLSHEYRETKKYCVRIYGKKYYSIINSHNDTYSNNLVCNAISDKFPVASHLTNFASYLRAALHLLHVDASRTCFSKNVVNMANCFRWNPNLLSVKGISYCPNLVEGIGCFAGCKNMESNDFVFPIHPDNKDSFRDFFYDCNKLTRDIAKFFSNQKFNARIFNIKDIFCNNTSLTGTVPADIFWEDNSINWLNKDLIFRGCSSAILEQVPESWGGTASDDVVEDQ